MPVNPSKSKNIEKQKMDYLLIYQHILNG